jgi:hypothetical protein
MVMRKPSTTDPNLNLYSYRANLHKETLALKHLDIDVKAV